MTPKDSLALMSDVDPWVWAVINKIKLQAGTFGKAGHEYLIEPMQSTARVKVKMKGAQMGFSEGEILDALHGMIKGKYSKGILYLFPTATDVSEFSKARFGPLINDNPAAIGKYVFSTDATNIKRIGTGMLYLRGARVTQRIGGIKPESSKLRSIPVDKIVCDERDLMPDEMVAMALERMAHSKVKEESYLSTPTIPDYGIDKIWQDSDQRMWFIKCSACGKHTCLELEFPECIIRKRSGDRYYRACHYCGGEIYPKDGHWQAQAESDIAGWRISQLNSIFVEPGNIIKAYEHPEEHHTTLQEVYNSKLALPYIAAEDRLSHQSVYSCCGLEPQAMDSFGPCAMGVDVGKMLHIVIGAKITAKQYKPIKIVAVPSWNDVHDLAKKFNVKCAVIDKYPEIHKAREFQAQESYSIFLCEYSEHLSTGHHWNLDKKDVTVNRTEVCDETHNLVKKPGMLLLPRMSLRIKEYAVQMCNVAKILQTDPLTGASTYRYIKLGHDHYRHATNYFYLAAQRIGLLSADSSEVRQELAEMEYAVSG